MPTPDPTTLPASDVLYAIYANPEGFAGQFVVRRWVHTMLSYWVLGDIETPFVVVDAIDQARQSIPEGYARSERFRCDRHDPSQRTIAEVWMQKGEDDGNQ